MKKSFNIVEFIVLRLLVILTFILFFPFIAGGLFFEGILYSSIPIVLIFIIKYKMKAIQEIALIILGGLIATYFTFLFYFLVTYHIFESILLILILIGFLYIIKSKKKIIIVLLDALYSFCRFLLWFFIFMFILIIIFCIILIIINIIYPPGDVYINFICN